jgi:hypothetical protein
MSHAPNRTNLPPAKSPAEYEMEIEKLRAALSAEAKDQSERAVQVVCEALGLPPIPEFPSAASGALRLAWTSAYSIGYADKSCGQKHGYTPNPFGKEPS